MNKLIPTPHLPPPKKNLIFQYQHYHGFKRTKNTITRSSSPQPSNLISTPRPYKRSDFLPSFFLSFFLLPSFLPTVIDSNLTLLGFYNQISDFAFLSSLYLAFTSSASLFSLDFELAVSSSHFHLDFDSDCLGSHHHLTENQIFEPPKSQSLELSSYRTDHFTTWLFSTRLALASRTSDSASPTSISRLF